MARAVKFVAVWGSFVLPDGYRFLAVVVLDPKREDAFFVIAAPSSWIVSASQRQMAAAVGRVAERELAAALRQPW